MATQTKQQPSTRILVVDDEHDVVTFCRRVLERSGYVVLTATEPERALELLRETDVDLLITDLKMPSMSGVELIEMARQHKPDLISVVITGYADTIEIAVHALRVGARDFLAKPFTIQELCQAVDHALREARPVREHSRLATLMPLLDLSRRGIAAHDMKALLVEGLAIACRALQGSAARFYRWHADREQLEMEHHHGHTDLSLPDAASLATLLRSSNQAFVLPDDGLEMKPSSPDHALAVAPALAPVGLVGAILVARCGGLPPFGQSDLEILTIMANQIAALYENARLVRELASWNQRLEKRVQEATKELAQSQERMLRSERLAAIGQLGASIAHELRNPWSVISNSVYYLKSRVGEEDPKARRHLEIIEDEVNISNEIITDLMSFARVRQLETHPEDPTRLVHQALARTSIPPNVSVDVEASTNGARVLADGDRLQQVLINLVNNAVQAMPEGGHLTLTTRAENGHIAFEVADTGVGIPEDQIEAIFEPLYTTRTKGVGMGLAIVQMLVEAHQGTIEVRSTPGRGSQFTVRVPRATPGDPL